MSPGWTGPQKLVVGTGNVLTIGAGDPRLGSARLSLGALGIVTEVTLDCVPHYQLEYDVYVGKFDTVMDNLDALKTQNERMLLWWLVPLFERDDVLIITKNRPGASGGIRPGCCGN